MLADSESAPARDLMPFLVVQALESDAGLRHARYCPDNVWVVGETVMQWDGDGWWENAPPVERKCWRVAVPSSVAAGCVLSPPIPLFHFQRHSPHKSRPGSISESNSPIGPHPPAGLSLTHRSAPLGSVSLSLTHRFAPLGSDPLSLTQTELLRSRRASCPASSRRALRSLTPGSGLGGPVAHSLRVTTWCSGPPPRSRTATPHARAGSVPIEGATRSRNKFEGASAIRARSRKTRDRRRRSGLSVSGVAPQNPSKGGCHDGTRP
jgi:hypothetical protein